jgi:cell division protein FtsB
MSGSRKLLWAAVLVASGLAAYSIGGAKGFRRYYALSRELSALEARNRNTAEENRQLMREIARLRDNPAELERAAREELGYVKPGEIVINLEP